MNLGIIFIMHIMKNKITFNCVIMFLNITFNFFKNNTSFSIFFIIFVFYLFSFYVLYN